jgi:uncharacterized membrane protein YozB (DUF420 family)
VRQAHARLSIVPIPLAMYTMAIAFEELAG